MNSLPTLPQCASQKGCSNLSQIRGQFWTGLWKNNPCSNAPASWDSWSLSHCWKLRFRSGSSAILNGLQTYPNLHPPLRVGRWGVFHEGGANLCRFVPVWSSQTRAWGGRISTCLFWSFGGSRAGRCQFGRVWSSLIYPLSRQRV